MSNVTPETSSSLNAFLTPLFKERFIHRLSAETYDALFSLWHLNPKIEKLLGQIFSKLVIAHFCARYLTHYHDLVCREAGITENSTSLDLSDPDKLQKLENGLHPSPKLSEFLEQEVLPNLKTILDQGETISLTDLIRLAHAGDYWIATLKELRKNEDPDYSLWLESIPVYYEKDLSQMGFQKPAGRSRRISLAPWISNLDQHLPCCEPALQVGSTFALQPRQERRRAPLGINRWTTGISS
ncbi:MAG: hypothetical protein HZA19_07050 [Nitrospirae bacterium]|nr:hypothetical protein [Nitrospirota bacterium]